MRATTTAGSSGGTNAELYNPATGFCTLTGNLSTFFVDGTATLLNNGMVLVAGGEYNGSLATAELF